MESFKNFCWMRGALGRDNRFCNGMNFIRMFFDEFPYGVVAFEYPRTFVKELCCLEEWFEWNNDLGATGVFESLYSLVECFAVTFVSEKFQFVWNAEGPFLGKPCAICFGLNPRRFAGISFFAVFALCDVQNGLGVVCV